ncbi:hypothetical protein E2C01_039189 [Portunus trituberculatus]|uniref:Uncharacterized protein n=1 Tax=Portunus trituberculatus TaxID=210409 RepID=A0A5B7FD02_PORTR|nr:hypothetical protein [Portunus trituberculatus]
MASQFSAIERVILCQVDPTEHEPQLNLILGASACCPRQKETPRVLWLGDGQGTAPCPVSSSAVQLLVYSSPATPFSFTCRGPCAWLRLGHGSTAAGVFSCRQSCSGWRGSRVLLARYKKFLFVPVCRRREARRGGAGRPSPRTRRGPVT